MDILLLGIYAFFVWLIFIKFKWLPWNTTSQVTVVIIPIVALSAMILTLNVVAPSSSDVRVLKYVVQIVPQVRGRVLEVPVEPNRLVKKGELLFRIDPTPYQNDLNIAKAKLAVDEAKLAQAGAGLADASAGARVLGEELKSASSQVRALQPRLELAQLRVKQNRELVAAGAGDRFALEQAEANVTEIQAQLATATANEAQVTQKLSGQVNGEQASVAAARAQIATAKAQVDASRVEVANKQWDLDQTSVYAPTSGYAINVQLRPGSFVAALPLTPAMSFVEETYQVIALYGQNELRAVEPGNEAEIALPTYPGRIIKATVDSIVWAQGQGQVAQSGVLPQTGAYPQAPGRFPVKLNVTDKDRELFLAAGANGRRGDLHQSRGSDPNSAQGDHSRRLDHQLPHPEAALMPVTRIVGRWALVVGAAGAIAGCAIKGPPPAEDIQREALAHTTLPAGWKGNAGLAQPVADRWLDSFNDPVLVALVDEALTYNADLKIAAARVEQAAGYVKVAGATLLPAVGVLAHAGGKSGGDGGLQGVWLNASLELDVWGRVRYGEAAAQAQFASADADYAYARQSLAAVVAKSYFRCHRSRATAFNRAGCAGVVGRAAASVPGSAAYRRR